MSDGDSRADATTITYGLVTRTAEELGWADIDRDVFEVKGPAGHAAEPRPDVTNAVACFRDAAGDEVAEELAQVDETGATRETDGAAAVCLSVERYRAGVLETIAAAGETSPDVRLDHVGFAGEGYCRCDRCRAAFAAAGESEWSDWRAATVERFVAAAASRVPGRLSLSVHPDPYPGHLDRRAGIDLDPLAEYLDEVVVPLYDSAYATTYWLETIASGFADELPGPLDLGIELYAADVDIDGIVDAVEAVEGFADTVYFGYGADTAVAAIRRRRATANDGAVYGP